jgi:hypothetical protein
MAKLLVGFVNEAFAQFAKSFMDLLSARRRRLSVGLDCGPWTQSGPSILTESPWAIAHAIIMAIASDVPFEIPELLVIPGIADGRRYDGTLPPRTSSPISREKKAKNRTLSSNQLFLGFIYDAARSSHEFSSWFHRIRPCGFCARHYAGAWGAHRTTAGSGPECQGAVCCGMSAYPRYPHRLLMRWVP